MFKGQAELRDPESGNLVATFTENGGRMKVVLKQPVTLSGTTRLAIYGTTEDAEIISVAAAEGQDTVIQEFEGESAVGPLPDKSDISLIRTPGGQLGTLLIVLGRGEIHEGKR
jgi:hypothetical protein